MQSCVRAPSQSPLPQMPLSGPLMMPEIPTTNISLKKKNSTHPTTAKLLLSNSGIGLSCFLFLPDSWAKHGLNGGFYLFFFFSCSVS